MLMQSTRIIKNKYTVKDVLNLQNRLKSFQMLISNDEQAQDSPWNRQNVDLENQWLERDKLSNYYYDGLACQQLRFKLFKQLGKHINWSY